MSSLPPRRLKDLFRDRRVLSWALYDWGNSAFATTVMAGFFPIFFKQFWSSEANVALSTARLGIANSIASLILGALAPVLGAMADRSSGRKKFLFAFACIGATSTASLYLVSQGEWAWACLLYVLGTVGFSGSISFYDALILGVARERELDTVSALGFALGYLGGGVLFLVNVLMSLKPGWFGIVDAAEAVRISFLMVGVWWFVFTLPLIFNVPEPPAVGPVARGFLDVVREGFAQLRQTFLELRQLRNVMLFLFAYFFYIDGVNTIIKMAVDYGMSLGFKSDSLIVALLLVQFIGFPAAIGFGLLTPRLGTRRSIELAIGVYVIVAIGAVFMSTELHFYFLAAAIGLVQGGIQSTSRAAFGQMIPADRSGEFFGFFNMLGRFSALLGPTLMAITALLSDNPRVSILSVLILFAGGWIILRQVEFKGEFKGEVKGEFRDEQ